MGPRAVLRAYAAVFAGAGAVFVLAPGLVGGLLAGLSGAPAPAAPGVSLWLGLTGSLMGVLTLLALEAAREPACAPAWRALLLSKGLSSGLFVLFAASGGRAFLLAALVDGAILLHLAWLREALEPLDAWRPRGARGHEAYFLIVHAHGGAPALWLRYERETEGGRPVRRVRWTATCAEGAPREGSWDAGPAPGGDALFAGAGGRLTRARAVGEGGGARWDLAVSEGPVPAYALVPRWLERLGLAGTMYATAAPAAAVSGVFAAGGRSWTYESAPACVGHLWGRRHGSRWRWAHAYWPERGVMAEALSAQGRLGPWRTPALRAAALWQDGRLTVRAAPGGAADDGAAWSLEAGGVRVRCAPDPARTRAREHPEPGRRLVVRHCTAGTLSLGPAAGPAAVEAAEEG